MSTNAIIARESESGIDLIYLHHDGDLAGEILCEHYSEPAKVDQLIALGDLSSLGKEIGEKQDFNTFRAYGKVCLAYHRDRGEDLSVRRRPSPMSDEERFTTLKDQMQFMSNGYLFREGRWYRVNLYKGTLEQLTGDES